MTQHILPKPECVQPRIPEGEAAYRALFEMRKPGYEQPMSLLSLDFSITLKKQSDGNWVQTSSTLDDLRQQFEAGHALLFKSNLAEPIGDPMTQAAQQTAGFASSLLEVLEKKPAVYKPKLIRELRHLQSTAPAELNKFVTKQKIEVKTNLFGRIVDVKKSEAHDRILPHAGKKQG